MTNDYRYSYKAPTHRSQSSAQNPSIPNNSHISLHEFLEEKIKSLILMQEKISQNTRSARITDTQNARFRCTQKLAREESQLCL
jgi:hypothetical protein